MLQKPPHLFFSAGALRDPLVLFQSHFLLFHCLYLLRNKWQRDQYSNLEISALEIKKTAFVHPSAAYEHIQIDQHIKDKVVFQSDSLAQYYLDWSHFSSTTSDDVDNLLNRFWKKMWIPQQEEEVQQALLLMELETPIPLTELKLQYRRLAQRYHPDKGGDSEHFKKICQAFHQLKQCVR